MYVVCSLILIDRLSPATISTTTTDQFAALTIQGLVASDLEVLGVFQRTAEVEEIENVLIFCCVLFKNLYKAAITAESTPPDTKNPVSLSPVERLLTAFSNKCLI